MSSYCARFTCLYADADSDNEDNEEGNSSQARIKRLDEGVTYPAHIDAIITTLSKEAQTHPWATVEKNKRIPPNIDGLMEE